MTGLLKGIGSRRCFSFFFSAGAVYAWFAPCCRSDGLHVARLTVQTTLYLKVSGISEAQELQASSSSKQSSLNYVCVCVYIYMYVYVRICTCTYICVYPPVKAQIRFLYASIHLFVYTHIYIYLHIYIPYPLKRPGLIERSSWSRTAAGERSNSRRNLAAARGDPEGPVGETPVPAFGTQAI